MCRGVIKMSNELLTQGEFAKLVGVSAPRISKLVKAGRIPLVDKKIPKEAGLTAWNNKHIGFERAAEAGKKFGGDPRTTKNNSIRQSLDEDDDVAPDDSDLGKRYNLAKTLEKEEMARKRKFENEVEQGKYVLKSNIEREAATIAAEMVKAFMGIPSRISVSLENKEASYIQEALEHELNEVIKVLHENGI